MGAMNGSYRRLTIGLQEETSKLIDAGEMELP